MANTPTQPVRQRHRETSLIKSPMSPMTPAKPKSTWIPEVTALVAVGLLFLMTIGFVKPLLMAGLFAATLYPYHLKLKTRIASNNGRAGLLTLGFAITFLLPIGAVAFLAANAGVKKFKALPADWTEKIQIENYLQILETYLPLERAEIVTYLNQAGSAAAEFGLTLLQNLASDLPHVMIVNVVILIGVYVILAQAPALLHWLHRFSPLSDRKTDILFRRVGGLSSSSILATIVSGIVQASIIGLVLLVVQYPGGLLITMTAFVLSFLPVVGTAPVAVYLIGSSVIEGNWSLAIVFLVTAVIVSVSDNIVRPYVLSDSAKLDGFIAFVAAIGALETMGFYGLFLGPVVAGAVFTLVELVHEDRTA